MGEAPLQLHNSLLGKMPSKMLSRIQWNSPGKRIWKADRGPVGVGGVEGV